MSANYCNKHPDWKGWSSEDCPHCYPPEIDELEEQRDSSQRRILELELEVKRLREALDPGELHVLIAKFICEDDRSPEWMRNLANQISGQALSTPPPALAEAYVRLRDACEKVPVTLRQSADLLEDGDIDGECEGVREMAEKVKKELAEVARLEKGE